MYDYFVGQISSWRIPVHIAPLRPSRACSRATWVFFLCICRYYLPNAVSVAHREWNESHGSGSFRGFGAPSFRLEFLCAAPKSGVTMHRVDREENSSPGRNRFTEEPLSAGTLHHPVIEQLWRKEMSVFIAS